LSICIDLHVFWCKLMFASGCVMVGMVFYFILG
jgi:hypothetical protein